MELVQVVYNDEVEDFSTKVPAEAILVEFGLVDELLDTWFRLLG